jgi:integrase
MATFVKRIGPRGTRWIARIRRKGRRINKTCSTKVLAEQWARSQETLIERNEYIAPNKSIAIFADAVDKFVAYKTSIGTPPGPSFSHTLERLKKLHGLELLSNLNRPFWLKHFLERTKAGVYGATAAADLIYAGSVLRHANNEEGLQCDFAAPGAVRSKLRKDGVPVESRKRIRRITDAEIKKLYSWIDKHPGPVPLRAICEFALATGMRQGEILKLRFDQIHGRVCHIKRKHPVEHMRIEEVPLLLQHKVWPLVDPVKIIAKQPHNNVRVFPYSVDIVGHLFRAACEGAGLHDLHFHDMRHCCLTRLSEDRGFDMLKLMKVASHRSPKSTLRYINTSAEKLAHLK